MPAIQPRPGILDIAPYIPGNIDTLDPEQVIYLASNETPLGASPNAVAAYQTCGQHLQRYPDAGSCALRETIAKAHEINPDQIVCGAGSERLIDLLARAYAGPGDQILYSQYGFLMYPICTRAAGAEPITAVETNYTANVDALLNAVTEQTRILFLANPNNPTGTYLNSEEITRLRDGLPPQVLLVIDSAYAEYVERPDYTAGHSLVENPQNNVVVLRTFSKIYGLAALRLGWAYCPLEIADTLNRIRGSFTISAPAQAASIAAIQDLSHTANAKQHNSKWLPWLQQALQEIGLEAIPSVANFVLVRFRDAESGKLAYDHLLKRQIVVRPMAGYGLPEALRITVGLEHQNQQCVEALQAFTTQYPETTI